VIPFLKCNLFYTKITSLYSNCIWYFPNALFKKAFTVRVPPTGTADLYDQDSSNQIHLEQAQTVRHVTRGQYGPVNTTCYDLRPETSPLLLFNGGQDCGAKKE